MKKPRAPKVRDKKRKKRIRGGQAFAGDLSRRLLPGVMESLGKTGRDPAKPKTEHEQGLDPFMDKIIVGDAEEVLAEIPDASVDMIITSPPYSFGLDYDQHQDTQSWEEYFTKLDRIWAQCERVLVDGGRIAVNVQPLFSDYVPTHHIISAQLMRLGLLWKAEILWEKHNYNAKYTAWGSWKSPSMPYLKYTWEFVEVFSKKTHRKTGRKQDIDITGQEFKKWVYGKWEIAPEKRMKEFGHPAVFPEELVRRLVLLFSYRGDVVLDPFNGVGTTTLVAAKHGRRYIGIDISENYCSTARQRIEEWQNSQEREDTAG